MLENNKGHIVSVASLAGVCGVAKLVDYCASKFAAVGFDEALRMELEVITLLIYENVKNSIYTYIVYETIIKCFIGF